MPYVPVIGLVGGVGSGKSSLARAVACGHPSFPYHSPLRILIVRGDETGHRALTFSRVKDQIRERFGAGVFTPDGEIDRPSVAKVVFGTSAAAVSARHDLESIVHPEIRRLLQEQIQEARTQGNVDAILLDAAILLESGWGPLCDTVVFVETPFEQRLRHVQNGRGWDEDELRRREASQWPLAEKKSRSDVVIENTGELSEAAGRLRDVIDEVIRRTNET